MEHKPAPSFIPKKPITHTERPKRRRGGGAGFALGAWVIFILTIAVGGAVYYYHNDVSRRVDGLIETLEERRRAFALEELDELVHFDTKLEAAKRVVQNHTAFSNFLTYLEEKTVRSVGFTDFSIEGIPGSSYRISLSAVARDYASFALQSEIFREHSALSQFEYSDIALVEDTTDAAFTIDMTISSEMITYDGDLLIVEQAGS